MFAEGANFEPLPRGMIVDKQVIIEPKAEISIIANPPASRPERKPAIRASYYTLLDLLSELPNVFHAPL